MAKKYYNPTHFDSVRDQVESLNTSTEPQASFPPTLGDVHRHLSKPRLADAAAVLLLLIGTVFLVPMAADGLLGLLLGWMVFKQKESSKQLLSFAADPLFICAALIVIYIGISGFWSPGGSAKGLIQLWLRISLIAVFLITLSAGLRGIRAFDQYLSHTVVLGALISAILCISWYLYAPPADYRLQGLFRFDNPGRSGRMYSAALPFAVFAVVYRKGAWRRLGALAFAVATIALVLSGTRAAWIAATLSTITFGLAILRPKETHFFILFSIAGCVLIALFAWALEHPEAKAALLPRGDSYRFEIWQANLQFVLDSIPWYGGGVLVDHWVTVGQQSFRGAHNMYLSVLIQTGLGGLAVFLTMIALTALRLVRHLNAPIAKLGLSLLVGGCVAFIFGGDRLVDKVNYIWFVIWIPVGIALSFGPLQPTLAAKADTVG